MKKMMTLMLALLLAGSPVMAQDVTHPPEEGQLPPTIQDVSKGEKALIDGVIFSPEAVATIIAEKKALPQQIQNVVDKAVEQSGAQCQSDKDHISAKAAADASVATAKLRSALKNNDMLLAELKKKERMSKLQKIWIGVSAVAGVAVAGALAGIVVAAK